MTVADKRDIQGMFHEFKEHNDEIRALENTAVLKELAEIKRLQEYANGTQKRHTKEIAELQGTLPHTPQSCPNREIIEKLNTAFTEQNGVKKWKTVALAIAAGFCGAIGGIVATMEFIMKYKPS